jgi:cytochrome c-type biogenesis protein CcmE
MKRKYRFLAGGAVIVAVVGLLLLTSMRSSTVYYLTVGELKSQVPEIYGERVRVAGLVDRESVVVEGEYSPDGVFQADTLVVQCPSKYEARVTE